MYYGMVRYGVFVLHHHHHHLWSTMDMLLVVGILEVLLLSLLE